MKYLKKNLYLIYHPAKKRWEKAAGGLGIRLISIHIPKTAGQSFVSILRTVYGDNNVFRYGRDARRDKLVIAERILVLHGHFKYFEISALHKKYNIPVVAWLRDPVERVISNYYFFIKRIRSDKERHNYHRKDETLLEYARRKDSRNRMSSFLRGIALRDLFFIGVLEYFTEELKVLGNLLGWDHINPVHINSNKEYKEKFGSIDKEIMEEIRRLNRKDIVLYNEAVSLREKRIRLI